ncbi:MAG: FtsK/SpoIIIE domain-containing protein [Actinomycetota bacterium]
MRLTIAAGSQSADYNVTLLAEDVTLADLFHEVGLDPAPATVVIDGRQRPTTEPIRVSGLTDGSVIDLDRTAECGGGDRRGRPPAAHLLKVAGHGTGDALPLTAGVYDLGTRAQDGTGLTRGPLTDATVRLRVTPDGSATVSPLTERPTIVAGHPVMADDHDLGDRLLTVTDGDGIPSIFAVRPERRRGVQRVVSSRPGRVTVLRPPRRLPPMPSTTVPVPDAPAAIRDMQPLSVMAMLGPIPAAVAMAFLFNNNRMLLMAAFSPLLVIGRWLEGKRRVRKGRIRLEAELAANAETLSDTLHQSGDRVATHLLAAQPHLGELVSRVELNDPRIWERRCHHGDFLHATLGYGSIPYPVETDGKPYGPLIDVLANARLHEVPLTLPLNQLTALGVAGEARATCALARAVLLEAAVLHGPADVQVSVISERPEEWAWIKWLPHAADDQGTIRVATDHESAVALIDELTPVEQPGRRSPFADDDAGASPVSLLILDGDGAIDTHTIRVADAVFANRDLRVVVIGSDPEQLPSYCAAIAVADGGGRVTVTDPSGASPDANGVAVMCDVATAEHAARRLGRLDDPERASASGGIPTYTSLEELLSSEDLTADDVIERWDAHKTHPKRTKRLDAVVGVTQDGPFSIDIVKDGPHAVVAGTTGSGKSELLRSWVAALASSVGPDRVNFVLVDFKGGGAFDACNDFPHTVGVVTDLDEHLSARALRCLKAELHYREVRLREAAASNIEEYWEARPDQPLPRLMLIVDEFATLAQELPEFLQSLVDVAQRGRSLGIHMILATQRPSGVLDAKIKANTNLRIALRVQDDADSADVIGTNAAARIDRRTPGRAMARLGAAEIVAFQSALVTVATDRTLWHSIDVVPFGIGEQARSRSTAATDDDAPTDLEQLVTAARQAHTALGLPPCRVPWPDPLPEAMAIADLPAPTGEAADTDDAGWAAVIGLADLPDEQRQAHHRFDATDGHLLVYGAESSTNTGTLGTIAVRLCEQLPPRRLHVYAIDFGSGGLSPLAELDHVATWVSSTDAERLLRVVNRLEQEIEDRRSYLASKGATGIGPDDDLPLVLVLIDNFSSLVSACEESGRLELPGRIGSILRDGADLGVIVVATSGGERGIPHRIAGQVTRKLVFRLADPGGYSNFGLRPREVPELGPGRGIEASEGVEVQIAQPSSDGLGADVARIAERWLDDEGVGGPEPVEVLPDLVPLAEVVDASSASPDRWRLSFARGHNTLGPAGFALRRGQHAVIAGPSGSGRSTALRSLAAAARASDPRCTILAVGFDGPPTPGVRGVEAVDDVDLLDLEHLAGRTLILVDDADRIDPELIRAVQTVIEAKRSDVHIIAASTPDDMASFQSWTKPLRATRIGLLLQPHRDDGEVLKTSLPLRGASDYPPGRGFMVNAGIPELAQVGTGGITAGVAEDGADHGADGEAGIADAPGAGTSVGHGVAAAGSPRLPAPEHRRGPARRGASKARPLSDFGPSGGAGR